ncbi:MAG: hypothetical protein QOH93_1499 [Chloroflexia bacterium]|jgi:hypothetical protein|nr:hypothetical protein [Chloroflexia bacterium]
MILHSRKWRLVIRTVTLVLTSVLMLAFAGAASYALQDDSPRPLTAPAQLHNKQKPVADTYVNVKAVPDLAHASSTQELLGEHYWIPLQGYQYQLFVRTDSGQYLFPYDYNPETGFDGATAPILYKGKITPLKGQVGADDLVDQLEEQGVTVDKENAMVLNLNEAPSTYRPVVPVMPVLAWMWLAALVGLVQIWRGKGRVLRTAPQPHTALR